MKNVVAIALLLIPLAVAAQANQDMSGADMQNYVQQMQACMAQVDQAKLEVLGQRSDEVDAEIASLCQHGMRDEAQDRAIAYSKEMADDPVVQQMKKCSEIVAKVMPGGEKPFGEDFDFANKHICDENNGQ